MPKTESSPAIWLDHQMTLDERGLISVLALAAKLGVLDQIPGGATAEQLSRCPDMPKHFMADPMGTWTRLLEGRRGNSWRVSEA
jgi:hypothetical protein